MNKFLRQCRELGIGVVVVDQHPHLISSAALGNTHTSICLNQKEPSDLNRAAAVSMLRTEERSYLSRLCVGEGIVKMQDRWHQPFLVRFPHVPVKKGAVSDLHLREYVEEGRRALSDLAARPVESIHALTPSLAIGSPGFRLLLDCVAYPTDGMQARYSRLGMSAAKGNRLKARLIRTGLAEGAVIPVGRTRRFILQSTAMAKGLRSLDPIRGRGSPEHEFWRNKYAEDLERAGWSVEVEAERIGGRVDLAAERNGTKLAIEIETGKSDALGNLRKCLSSDLDYVIVVATNEKAMRRIKQTAEDEGLAVDGRVSFVLRDGADVKSLGSNAKVA